VKAVIGHISDLHIGAGLAFGTINPETGMNTFTERQLDAAEYAIQLMAAENVDTLLITGDIFDHPDPSSALIQGFQKVLDLAVFKGMTVVLITGNHDKTNDRSNAVRALVRNHDERVLYVDYGFPVVVNGIKFVMHDEDCEEGEGGGLFTVGLFHGIIPGSSAGHIKFDNANFRIGKGISAVLAGDVHLHQSGIFDGRVWYYAGTLTRLNFGEKDYAPGFGIATVTEEGNEWVLDYKHVSTEYKSLKFVELDIKDQAGTLGRYVHDTVYKVTGPEHLRDAVSKAVADGGGVLFKYLVSYNEAAPGESKVARREEMNPVAIVDKLDIGDVIKEYLKQFVQGAAQSGLRGDYRLSELVIRGFGPFSDTILRFSDDDKSYAVVGSVDGQSEDSNGAGKSFIFDAIKVCLFGTTYRGLQAGWGVNAKQAFIGLTLKGERELKVERTIEKSSGVGKQTIAVFVDGVEQKNDRLKDHQGLINELMGVSEQGFEVSTMIGSKDFSLVDKTSAFRVDYLIDLFNMNGIDAASDDIASQSRIAASNLAAYSAQYQNMSAQLGHLQSQSPQQCDPFTLIAYKDEWGKANQAAADIQARLNNLEASRAAARTHNQGLVSIRDAASREVINLQSQATSAEVARSQAQNKLTEAQQSVDANKCPLCGNSIDAGHVATHIFQLTLAVAQAEEAEKKADLAVKEANERLVAAEMSLGDGWQDETIDDASIRQELLTANQLVAHYANEVQKLEDANSEYERHQAVVEAMDQQVRLANINMAIAQAEVVKWAYIASKFDAPSIKEGLISSVSETLNAKATASLSRIFGNAVGVRFDASLQTTKNKTIPKFDIYVVRDDERVPFEQYSKGEQGAVRVAVDLAVSDLVSQVNPARFRFLIFDEAFDNLSPAKRESVADLIQELVATRGSTLAVAHTFKMSTKFGGVISVTKTGKTSVITQQ
jgi:DNA repair exonuclease SbcCD ATPase subunit/DNA repair exonuclease SbcCD nuclease subunit